MIQKFFIQDSVPFSKQKYSPYRFGKDFFVLFSFTVNQFIIFIVVK